MEGDALQQAGGWQRAHYGLLDDEDPTLRRAGIGILLAAAACQQAAPARREVSPDSLARLVADAIARKDIDSLAALAHPEKGIRFSPYAHVDTATDLRLTADRLRAQWSKPDSLTWGSHDGSGAPIRLSFREYFDKFVRDFDVARAPRIARDSAPMGTGNVIFNVRQVYPDASIVEFNTPGADPKYGGMDWRSLWIVLQRDGERWAVTGIVHGAWTI